MIKALALSLLLSVMPFTNLDKALTYVNSEGSIGYASQISPRHILTASHVVSDGGGYLQDGFKKTPLEFLWRSNRDKGADLAMLLLPDGAGFQKTLMISKQLPKEGSDIFWICLLPVDGEVDPSNLTKLYVRGTVLGYLRARETMLADGFSAPGCSGSPVLNEQGEIVGVFSGSFGWSNQASGLGLSRPVQIITFVFGSIPKGR